MIVRLCTSIIARGASADRFRSLCRVTACPVVSKHFKLPSIMAKPTGLMLTDAIALFRNGHESEKFARCPDPSIHHSLDTFLGMVATHGVLKYTIHPLPSSMRGVENALLFLVHSCRCGLQVGILSSVSDVEKVQPTPGSCSTKCLLSRC